MRTLIAFVSLLGFASPAVAQRAPRALPDLDDPRHRALVLEIAQLERDLDATPLEGPAVLTLAGAAAFAGGVVALGFTMAAGVSGLGCTSGCGSGPDLVTPTIAASVGGFAGLVALVSGAIWWSVSDRRRGQLTEQIEVRELDLQLDPVLAAGPGGVAVGLEGSF